MKLRLILFVFLLAFFGAKAQVNDKQLASFYYQQGEYEKAVLYYQKLYEREPLHTYYEFYLKSLYELERTKDAKELIKRQQRIFSNQHTYDMDLADFYRRTGDEKKSDKILQGLIDNLSPRYNDIQKLAEDFSKRGESVYALRTFQKGRKILPAYPFNMEIARLQGELGNTEEMIKEYLDLLDINPAYLQSVQSSLNRGMSFEKGSKENTALKTELYKRIQRNPERDFYNDLLIWMLIQEKDFEAVYRQSVSMDKRKGENGYRLLDLANLGRSNGNYELAIKALDYVADKGKDSPLFIDAKVMLLQVLYEKVRRSNTYSDEDLERLENEYHSSLKEVGKNARTVQVMRELAEIQGVYRKKYEEALQSLDEAISMPGVPANEIGELKLLKADIKLLQNEPWEASLLYMQVEKAFTYDRLGELAKFNNAKIYYYEAEFELAKAMLDVLKGSTSKKIANDAMDLSLLITDNSTVDTSLVPLKMFARADFLFTRALYEDSKSMLDSINLRFPGHALSDEILFMRYKIALGKANYPEAEAFLLELLKKYDDDILSDDAVFALAQLYENKLNNRDKAVEYYKMLLVDFKDSLFVVEARKRYRELRGDQIN